MKSLRSVRQQNGNLERSRSGKRSEKYSKLDRKSSRGMIYENEELRLRTININAEVERGQTDIKRLRKENEQLRREIWTLRDECDQLNKRVKAKFIEHEQGVYSVRCSGGNSCSCQYNDAGDGCEGIQSRCNSEDSDSCDSYCCHEENISPCTEECCNENKKFTNSAEKENLSNETCQNDASEVTNADAPPTCLATSANFDHLSVVSEETLSNSEVVLAQQSENLMVYAPDIGGSQTTLPSLVGSLTPLTPVELVANQLNDLQSAVPPLSYFENVLQQHMSSNYDSRPESSSTTNSGKNIVKHTNGWDYKLESPFSSRLYQANSISPILTKRIPAQTLTTFVPSTTLSPPPSTVVTTTNVKPILSKKPNDLSINSLQHPIIETVPITTLPPNGYGPQTIAATKHGNNNGSTTPRHFFAPIKPKLKLNTTLANQKRLPPPLPAVTKPINQVQSPDAQQKNEPPDIYVTNALATPYRPPSKPSVKPPPVPQRITSTSTMQAQVSSTQHSRNRQLQPHHRKQHQMRPYQNQQIKNVVVTNNDVHEMPVIYTSATSITATNTKTITTVAFLNSTNILCSSMKTNLTTFCPLPPTMTTTHLIPNLCNSLKPLITTPTLTTEMSSSAATTFSTAYLTSTKCPPACFKFINSNINFRKPNDPVYAIAQNVCHNLITASAVTQPLMSSIVKCCKVKQKQQLQLQPCYHITAASNQSTEKSFHTTPDAFSAADDVCSDGVIVTTPPSLYINAALPPSPSSSSVAELSSVSCTATINSSLKKTITTTSMTTSTTSTNFIVIDSMCQRDSANLESILNDIEAISEDILAIQLVKNKSRENVNNKSTESVNKTEQPLLQHDNKNSKPYRSEMNLLLTYYGDNPTIKPANSAGDNDNNKNTESMSNSNTSRRARSLERDHTDSPSPNIPDPMQPFPADRKYIGFDRINKAAVMATTSAPLVAATGTQTVPVINSPLSQRTHLPLSPLVTNINTPKSLNNKQLPPTPPTRTYPTPLIIKCAGVARSSSVSGCSPAANSSTNLPGQAGVSPTKSQLYAALANAAAKRAQFRSQPTNMTRSLDSGYNLTEDKNDEEKCVPNDAIETTDSIKHNTRRVSIVCADTDSPGSPEKPLPTVRTQLGLQSNSSGSCTDLHAVLQNPALRSLKQTSQSTPNSPHSSRKHENSQNVLAPHTVSITSNSTLQQERNSAGTSGVSQLLAHNHIHSNSYPNVTSPLTQQQAQRKSSQDAIKASAAEIACAAAHIMRTKCSRRHSDSNVSHTNQRISGASGGTNGTHHHHLHNHHHRQHSSSLASNTNPHQSHHSRRDSNQETVASLSDRNSNSLASSRESSASFSMRSQRRKLSVSSHTGGKIPWCGCWGNGCL